MVLAGRRYIVCRNRQEAEKDAADRASIVAALERQLAKGDKALVGSTGFRRYLKTISEERFANRRLWHIAALDRVRGVSAAGES